MKKLFLISTLFIGVSAIFLSYAFSFDLSDLFSEQEWNDFSRAMGIPSQEPVHPAYRAEPATRPSIKPTPQKKETKPEEQKDEKTLFLSDLKEKEDQVSTALKNAYNTFMQKITDLLKSIERKSFEVLPEVIGNYADIINPIVTVHGEIKNQDENLALFFSAKMNKVRLQLYNAIDSLINLDKQLDELLTLKKERDEKHKEELKKLADEKQSISTPDEARNKKRMAGLRSGTNVNGQKVTDAEEREVQLIEQPEAPEKIDPSQENKEPVS